MDTSLIIICILAILLSILVIYSIKYQKIINKNNNLTEKTEENYIEEYEKE